jgi:hypothetical protein
MNYLDKTWKRNQKNFFTCSIFLAFSASASANLTAAGTLFPHARRATQASRLMDRM